VREYVRSIHMLGDAHFLGMSGNIVESHSLYRAQIAFPSNPDRAVELTEIRQELARIDRLRMIDGGLRFYEGQDLAFERAEADDQAGVGEWVFEAVPEDFEYR
jgi:hypothetical protein